MRVAKRTDAHHDAQISEREVAAWRHEVRLQALAHLANEPAKPPRSVRIGVVVCLLLLLATSLIGLRRAMQVKIRTYDAAIQIVFIDESQLERSLPEPKAEDARDGSLVRARVVEHTIAAKPIPSPVTQAIPDSPAPAYRVFNPDGSVILPAAVATQGMQATFVAQSTAPSPIMRHQRPLKARPNHFAGNWQVPDGETIVGAFVREHLTADTQFMTPWGTLVKCRVVAVMGGCTWGPPPVWQPTQTWRPATALDEE